MKVNWKYTHLSDLYAYTVIIVKLSSGIEPEDNTVKLILYILYNPKNRYVLYKAFGTYVPELIVEYM